MGVIKFGRQKSSIVQNLTCPERPTQKNEDNINLSARDPPGISKRTSYER